MMSPESLRHEEFLSEEDLDLVTLSYEELLSYWNLWLQQAQATNEDDADDYSHGVFVSPSEARELLGDDSWLTTKPQQQSN